MMMNFFVHEAHLHCGVRQEIFDAKPRLNWIKRREASEPSINSVRRFCTNALLHECVSVRSEGLRNPAFEKDGC